MTEKLFGHLPNHLFSPLSGKNRHLYARLLLRIYRTLFADALLAQPYQDDVIGLIEQEADRLDRSAFDAEDGLEATDKGLPRQIYNRLRDAGWLVEHAEGYHVLVDIQPEVAALLDRLGRIEQGIARGYGGRIVSISNDLRAAIAEPRERAQGVAEAAESSKDFLRHLKGIISGLREIEKAILANSDIRSIFRSFFDIFVANILISDYKSLKTANNPFRFRREIITLANRVLDEPGLRGEICTAYLEQGRCHGRDEAERAVEAELEAIRTVFEQVDDYLDRIEMFRGRLERRILNTIHYMDRAEHTSVAQISGIIKTLSRRSGDDAAQVAQPGPLTPAMLPWSPAVLYKPRQRRKPPTPGLIVQRQSDPAWRSFIAATQAYNALVHITPAKLEAYIERHLDAAGRAATADFTIETVDDLLAFQRLRSLPYSYGASLARRYRVTPTGGTFSSEWMTCPDFVIARITDASVEAQE